ncbi:hypothetical protein Glove_18g116 [Diversispora epigaea]|uniref:Uncharacterized protein n=1 Tax=Diversispora epigaea TaxID=1348612 RepID=A0A397JW98_9GLOM|nr:hypothetical protein Glove_18g116 [Diversispora epigaea]
MNKLQADITYKQIITDENNENEQIDEQDDKENLLYESKNSFISEDINEEIEIINIEEKEKKSMDKLEEIDNDETENITHSAIDLNAK